MLPTQIAESFSNLLFNSLKKNSQITKITAQTDPTHGDIIEITGNFQANILCLAQALAELLKDLPVEIKRRKDKPICFIKGEIEHLANLPEDLSKAFSTKLQNHISTQLLNKLFSPIQSLYSLTQMEIVEEEKLGRCVKFTAPPEKEEEINKFAQRYQTFMHTQTNLNAVRMVKKKDKPVCYLLGNFDSWLDMCSIGMLAFQTGMANNTTLTDKGTTSKLFMEMSGFPRPTQANNLGKSSEKSFTPPF